jgi:hypothetical protein
MAVPERFLEVARPEEPDPIGIGDRARRIDPGGRTAAQDDGDRHVGRLAGR